MYCDLLWKEAEERNNNRDTDGNLNKTIFYGFNFEYSKLILKDEPRGLAKKRGV